MSKVTIRDVAQKCGLSIATVSRVLAGSDYPVKPETRQLILDAANECGYVPNMLARGLKINQGNEIAVIVPSIQNPFYTSVVKGIETALLGSGYSMLLYITEVQGEKSRHLVDSLQGKMVAGVIIAADSMNAMLAEKLQYLKRILNTKVMVFDHHIGGCAFPGVYFDYFAGARMATEYVIGLGHTRIAFASGPMDRETRRTRLAGYKFACETLLGNNPEQDCYVCTDETDFMAGAALAVQIAQSQKGYTAILAINDSVGVGLLAGLAEQHIRVPEDISVVGFDDCIYAKMCSPMLTTIRVPSEDIGLQAAKHLLQELRDGTAMPSIYMEPEIVERNSAAACV